MAKFEFTYIFRTFRRLVIHIATYINYKIISERKCCPKSQWAEAKGCNGGETMESLFKANMLSDQGV
jgi:hypothetical protein